MRPCSVECGTPSITCRGEAGPRCWGGRERERERKRKHWVNTTLQQEDQSVLQMLKKMCCTLIFKKKNMLASADATLRPTLPLQAPHSPSPPLHTHTHTHTIPLFHDKCSHQLCQRHCSNKQCEHQRTGY